MNKSGMVRILGAVTAGILLALAFPHANFSGLALVALVPLLWSLHGVRPLNGFLLGWLAGIIVYGVVMFWGLIFGWPPYVVSVLYKGLFCGIFGLLAALWLRRQSHPWSVGTLFFLALAWTASEWLRAQGPFGSTFGALGYTQYRNLPLIQVAALGGLWAVSFLVVLINGYLAFLLERWRLLWRETVPARSSSRIKALGLNLWQRGLCLPLRLVKREGGTAWTLILPLAVIILGWGWGRLQLNNSVSPAGISPLRTALIQVNVNQNVKWDARYFQTTLDLLEGMTRGAADDLNLVVWPETAVPTNLSAAPALMGELARLAENRRFFLVAGAPEINQQQQRWNSVFVFSPFHGYIGKYSKMHLVPFGEYLPLRKYLQGFKLFSPVNNYTPGDSYMIFPTDRGRFASLVCFESFFPYMARENVKRGARLLVVVTNDAWFLRTSVAHQHFIASAFRALENRVWLLQSANTGVSGIVDPYGRIQASTPLFQRRVVLGSVGAGLGGSLYTIIGDIPLLALLLLAALILVLRVRHDMRLSRQVALPISTTEPLEPAIPLPPGTQGVPVAPPPPVGIGAQGVPVAPPPPAGISTPVAPPPPGTQGVPVAPPPAMPGWGSGEMPPPPPPTFESGYFPSQRLQPGPGRGKGEPSG